MKDMGYQVQGFKASAISAGLKKDKALDLALIVSEHVSAAAGVFTTNKVKAAPLILTQEHIGNGKARAIITNAGNANACTGERGLNDAHRTADLVARELGVPVDEVLVASTGVIGQPLDIGLITDAIPDLARSLSPEGIPSAAHAIMTTDSFPKISQSEGQSGGRPYGILGIAKGAGMIMPDMATMLAFILSDIRIDAHDLKQALVSSTEATFNRISVDGETSTNDMVLVMANGMAGNKALSESDYEDFTNELQSVMGELACMIVRDGEGATKVVHMEIKGAASASDARSAARTVANSNLVKTSFYGQDPNWGRIMAALGRAEIVMEETSVDIWVEDVQIVAAGLGKGAEAEK
jgi:glutamate N-acetyltransferase/amino-acid N-acetyltransferase